jgi:hypothetical protein
LVVLLLVGVMMMSSAVVLASHLANSSLSASTTGARFSGTWEWYSASEGTVGGGWHFWGTLYDTNSSDGDNVYNKVQAEAYNPNSFYGVQNGSEYQNYEVGADDQLTTRNIKYWVCRDRSAPYSDNCSSQQSYSR